MAWHFVDGSRMRGGEAYRQQQALKDMVRLRDNFTCQICGSFGWDCDHIDPWEESHASTLGNYRVLCHQCNVATRRPRKDARLPLDAYYAQLEAELGLQSPV